MLHDIIKLATDELKEREINRDQVLGRARRARLLSKQAILLNHNKEHEKATDNLTKARSLIQEMIPYIQSHPEFDIYEEVDAAYQEHAEATILHSIVTKNTYPTMEHANVTPTRYLLGLADVPGELRREALEALRIGDLEAAEAYLAHMEDIYLHLVAMEDSLLLKGLRRKLDVARSVIESTRGDVTQEAGRARLSEKLSSLSFKLGS